MKPRCQFAVCFLLVGALFITSCKKEYSCEGCLKNDKPPVANAGNDTVITLPVDSILLDGSKSYDSDGRISQWLWRKVSGPASSTIANAATAKTVSKKLTQGVYQFELAVTDDRGLVAKDTVQITVNAAAAINHPPIANAGSDTTIDLPANTANLDGSKSSDPDNNITSYQWTKISGPSSFKITNANSVQTQVSNLVQGVYSFELKVTDAGGLSAADTVQVTVSVPPHIDSSLIGKEFIFDAKWELDVYDMGPPGFAMAIVNPSPAFSIAAMLTNPLQISIQLDTSSVWINVTYWNWYRAAATQNPIPPNNGYIWDFPGYPYSNCLGFDIEPDPDNHQLVGRPFKLKVKFL